MQLTFNFDDNLPQKDKADLMNTLWVVARATAKEHFKGAQVDDSNLSQLANDEWDKWGKHRWE